MLCRDQALKRQHRDGNKRPPPLQQALGARPATVVQEDADGYVSTVAASTIAGSSVPVPNSKQMCTEMQRMHGVLVRRHWGTLPRGKQREWTAMGCDRLLAGA